MQQIVIRRSVKDVELFDQMPSPLHGDWWLTLLCRGGNIFDMIFVIAAKNGCTQPLPTYRWYTRSLFKSLLLVSAIQFDFLNQ